MISPVRVAVWGASGHARIVAEIVQLRGEYRIHCFVDNVSDLPAHAQFLGLPVLTACDPAAELWAAGVRHLVVAVGDNAARLRIAEDAATRGFTLVTVVHPKAVIAGDVQIDGGTVIAAGAIVNPGAKIAANVIINTAATVDHDCEIGPGVHLSPGVHLGGGVVVGRGAWIGVGASVRDHLRIGEYAVIGVGSAVVTDIPDRVIAYGVPARVIRGSDENGKNR